MLNEPRIGPGEMQGRGEWRADEIPARHAAEVEEGTRTEDALDPDLDVCFTRGEVLEALEEMPDNCTMDDVFHTLYMRSQLKRAIWSLENEPTYTQEEVEQSLSRWLTD
jgi:hypothetical protein